MLKEDRMTVVSPQSSGLQTRKVFEISTFLWLKLFWQKWSFPRAVCMCFLRKYSRNSSRGRQLLDKAAQRGLCAQMPLFVFTRASCLPWAESGCLSEPNTSQTLFPFGSIAFVMALEASRAGGDRKSVEDTGGRKSSCCPFRLMAQNIPLMAPAPVACMPGGDGDSQQQTTVCSHQH